MLLEHYAAAVVVCGLCAAEDIGSLEVPDRVTLPALALGLAHHALFGFGWKFALAGAAFGLGLGLLMALCGGGGGDAKLLAALGAWLGWAALTAAVLLAHLAGLVWLAARRLRGQRDARLPYAPCLWVALGVLGVGVTIFGP